MMTPGSRHTAAKSTQRLLLARRVNFLVQCNTKMAVIAKIIVLGLQCHLQQYVNLDDYVLENVASGREWLTTDRCPLCIWDTRS